MVSLGFSLTWVISFPGFMRPCRWDCWFQHLRTSYRWWWNQGRWTGVPLQVCSCRWWWKVVCSRLGPARWSSSGSSFSGCCILVVSMRGFPICLERWSFFGSSLILQHTCQRLESQSGLWYERVRSTWLRLARLTMTMSSRCQCLDQGWRHDTVLWLHLEIGIGHTEAMIRAKL